MPPKRNPALKRQLRKCSEFDETKVDQYEPDGKDQTIKNKKRKQIIDADIDVSKKPFNLGPFNDLADAAKFIHDNNFDNPSQAWGIEEYKLICNKFLGYSPINLPFENPNTPLVKAFMDEEEMEKDANFAAMFDPAMIIFNTLPYQQENGTPEAPNSLLRYPLWPPYFIPSTSCTFVPPPLGIAATVGNVPADWDGVLNRVLENLWKHTGRSIPPAGIPRSLINQPIPNNPFILILANSAERSRFLTFLKEELQSRFTQNLSYTGYSYTLMSQQGLIVSQDF